MCRSAFISVCVGVGVCVDVYVCMFQFFLSIYLLVDAQVAAPFRVGVEGSAGDRHAAHSTGADGQSVAIVGRQP